MGSIPIGPMRRKENIALVDAIIRAKCFLLVQLKYDTYVLRKCVNVLTRPKIFNQKLGFPGFG